MTTGPIACPACGLDLGHEPAAPAGPRDDDEVTACPACGHGQFFRVEPAGDVCVVHLKGRGIVTEQNVMRVLERVRHLVDGRGCGRVLLDFDGVTHLSSTILGRMINLAQHARTLGAHLKLCNLRPDVRDIFRITRLEDFFEMHPGRPEAIAAF